MQRSKLDEVYSLSNKFTREEMISKISNYENYSLTKGESELAKYIDPFTKKVCELGMGFKVNAIFKKL